MEINVYLFLGLHIIVCSQYYLIIAQPLIGPNIRNARINEFPFVVSLIKYVPNDPHPERNHLCTGSLITRRDVAISAHCLQNQDVESMQIKFLSIDARMGQRRFLYWWLTYEHWAIRKRIEIEFDVNDIANLRLLKFVPITIVPVQIPNISNRRLYHKGVVTAGWGWINATLLNTILNTAQLTVLTNNDCIERISRLANQTLTVDPRHVVCTMANPHVLLTYGDSGGPLLYNNKLVGINRGSCPNTVEETHPELVNLHMSVHYYRRFLLNAIRSEAG